MPPKSKKTVARSAAEFFADNKSIAGFDNPGKSTYTAIREFVENSLDAAEDGRILPDVIVMVDCIDKKIARPPLYGSPGKPKPKGGAGTSDLDFEPAAAEPAAADPADPGGGTKKAGKAAAKKKFAPEYFRVTVRDNAVGMPHDEVANMLGRVLSGTKYGVQQSRGRFGLGAKMALIWSKMSTAGELVIYTATAGKAHITKCKLDMDLHKNEPKIISLDKLPNDGSVVSENGSKLPFPPDWRGTEISVMFQGNWSTVNKQAGPPARTKVISYLRQLAVITPFAMFQLHYTDVHDRSKTQKIRYMRRTETMPPKPQRVQHHPSSVNLTKIQELMRLGTERNANMPLKRFLMKSFDYMTGAKAKEIIAKLGKQFEDDLPVTELDQRMQMHLQTVLKNHKWPAPTGKALSPAGGYNMFLGILKEFKPDLVVTEEMPPSVFEGHAFIVEAAVSIGGSTLAVGINCVRFANRIPLMYEQASDVVYKTAQSIKWKAYKIDPAHDKIGVYVSIVSTKIPFKGTGKEFISADCIEIAEQTQKAIQKCCAQLKTKISKRDQLKSQGGRRKELLQYVPNVADSIFTVLGAMDTSNLDEGSNKRARIGHSGHAAEAFEQLTSGTLSAQLLEIKLRKHVDQYDATEALEFMAQQGRGVKDLQPEEIYIGRQRAVADAVRITLPGMSLTVARDIVDPRSLPVIR